MNASAATSHSISFTISVDDVVAYLRLLQRRLNTIGVILGIVIMGIGSVLAVITNDASTGVWTFAIGALFVVLAGTEFLDPDFRQPVFQDLVQPGHYRHADDAA